MALRFEVGDEGGLYCAGNISVEITVLLTLEMLVEHGMCYLFIHSFYFHICACHLFSWHFNARFIPSHFQILLE